MIYVCPICHLQLIPGEEHPTLVECVRALVSFVNQLDKDLNSVSIDAVAAQETADAAKDLAYGLENRIEEVEREIA